MSYWNQVQIINLVEKYKTHAFNKANAVMTVTTEFFCYSHCSLGQVEWCSSKVLLNSWKEAPLARQTLSSSSQNKHVLCIKSVMAWNFYHSLYAEGLSQCFCQGHHLLWSHVPYNKIFVSQACTIVCGSCGRLYSFISNFLRVEVMYCFNEQDLLARLVRLS